MAQTQYQLLLEGTRDKNRPACEGWCGEKTHDAKGEPIWTLVDRSSPVGFSVACIEAPSGLRFTPHPSMSLSHQQHCILPFQEEQWATLFEHTHPMGGAKAKCLRIVAGTNRINDTLESLAQSLAGSKAVNADMIKAALELQT